MTARPSTAARHFTTALAIFALIVVPLASYTAGYFWLGEYVELQVSDSAPAGHVDLIDRIYPRQWIAIVFRPAAKVEGRLRGIHVITAWRESGFAP